MVEPKKSLSRANVWFVHPGLLLKYAGLCEGGHPPSVDLRKVSKVFITIHNFQKFQVVSRLVLSDQQSKTKDF